MIPESLQREQPRCAARRRRATTLYVAITDPLDDETYAALREHTDLEPPRLPRRRAPTSTACCGAIHQDEYVRAARTELLTRFPEDCANRVLSDGQRAFFIGLLIVIAVAAIFVSRSRPAIGLVIVSRDHLRGSPRSTSSSSSTTRSAAAGDRRRRRARSPRSTNATLPIYTILVPLYRRGRGAARARREPRRARLPEVEARGPAARRGGRRGDDRGDPRDGPARRSSRRSSSPTRSRRRSRRPATTGSSQATGKYVVIYDAEDQPDPDQLKKACIAFERTEDRVVCIQCKLNYFNSTQNLLTRFFATEYALWFDLLLPGLDAQRRADPARRHLEPLRPRGR